MSNEKVGMNEGPVAASGRDGAGPRFSDAKSGSRISVLLRASFAPFSRLRRALRRLLLPGDSAAENALFLGLILVGAAVRLVWLGDVPLGLHQDEASIGYEAWALLEHGIDRHGYRYPVHFVAWGSGQNALYAYLAMPFIEFLGLTVLAVRLPQAILGVAALFVMHAVGRRLVDGRFALCALFVLAISPWHIMLSRWGLESNLLPVLVLFAFALLLRGLERPRCIALAFVVLSLALYAYGTAYVFVPLFTLGILAYGWRRRLAHFRHWIVGLAAMALVALPIGLFLVVNLFKLPAIALPLLSIPRYTGDTRLVSESVFFAEEPFGELLRNAKMVFDILVVDGYFVGYSGGPFIHNALPEFGYFYHPVGQCIALAGACFIAWHLISGRRPRNTLVAIWLGAAIVTATLTEPHLQRLNLALFPLLLCAAYGLYGIAASGVRLVNRTANILRVAALAYLALSFAAFARHYFVEFNRHSFEAPPSYAQALAHAIAHAGPDDAIYVPKRPFYTAILFYDPPAPRLYMDTVQFEEMHVAFQQPTSFGRYRVYPAGIDAEAVENGDAFVVRAEDVPMFPTTTFDVMPFEHFSAVIRR